MPAAPPATREGSARRPGRLVATRLRKDKANSSAWTKENEMKDGMNEEGQKGGCTVTLERHLLACLRVPQPIQRVPAARRGLHCGVQLVAGLGPAALTDQRTPERRLRLHGTTLA